MTDERTGRGMQSILVVEDEPAIRKGMQRVLESGGYTVRTATTPIQAIELAADHEVPIDLLVTDFGLHAVTGRQVADVLLQGRPNLRVLYVSGHPESAVLPHGRGPAASFLQKPFSPVALLAEVRGLLDPEAHGGK